MKRENFDYDFWKAVTTKEATHNVMYTVYYFVDSVYYGGITLTLFCFQIKIVSFFFCRKIRSYCHSQKM